MNFILPDLFNFAKKSIPKSKFKGTKKIAGLSNTFFDEVSISFLNPQYLFNQLVHGKIDLELIQVFALMGWENNQWTSKKGKIAMRHWWLSALDKDQQGESIFRHIMTLRVILADTERYPAPKDVIQTMRTTLDELIESGEWTYQINLNVLRALITQDTYKLAMIALSQQKSVISLIQEAGFPTKLPLIQDAELIWLNGWIEMTPSKRSNLRHALSQLLTNTLPLERQNQFIQKILNAASLPKTVQALEKQVENYPELVTWLSTCARNIEFKSTLNLSRDEKDRLACWIGTGNYESLRKILTNIARIHNLSTIDKTTNRYIFWKNYQALFQEAWLLLPPTLFERNETHLHNVKKISAYSYPVVVLKLGNKFIFQSFLGDASENDLLMTDDIEQVERILHQDTISYDHLKNLNLVLIHDHTFKWQSDLAYTLDKHFNIQPKDNIVHYMEGKYRYSNYLEDVNQDFFKAERKDWKNLPRWIENNKRSHKYPEHVFNRAALTAIRYGLITVRLINELEQGVWTDPNTGLMWARISIGQRWENGECIGHAKTLNLHDAEKECKNLNLAAFNDWRLPTVREISSLIIYMDKGYNCPTDILFRPEKNNWGDYWSASSYAYGLTHYVDFNCGRSFTYDQNGSNYARAVRNSR